MSESAPWYEAFYKQDYLDIYGHRFTPEISDREVAFATRVLELAPGHAVLDLCSGYGRHAVRFAAAGVRVAGIDQSAQYLRIAAAAARDQGVEVANILGDMRYLPFPSASFDAAVNVFSSFGYLETEAEDARVLGAVADVLKPGGRFLVDLMNREWAIRNYVPDEWHKGPDGTLYLEHRDLDLATSRNNVSFVAIGPDGSRREGISHHIRLYTLREVIGMLAAAALDFETAFGDFEGAAYSIATRRMIVVARKPG